ncbi:MULTISPECIES: hypothetical protein [unclassified Colwellia]|uniref:hypothetical protein n=1 Tax=unclassified Colwellia TaxID=196834 RepID=UPI0015F3CC95|nr:MULTISPECIES: hypothetical protein [unclassified Colwellia]MBA6379693.1 hypothetical protein [Colwellia sp. BRX10-7]MBA6388492.1 hypothetical protein [Colwellia sp. BRX10-2]MBA6402994.1 hypothetical protein [Colwellia sp. BRX10-5]MBA6406311.1 hypothetical protein [Colwellia sp. BRX10-1]
MEFLLIIGGIWFLFIIFGSSKNKDTSDYRPSSPSPRRSTPPPQPKVNTQTFRPKTGSKSTAKINFQNTSNAGTSIRLPSENDLKGLHDAFTGASLDKALGLYQCQSCKVYYHKESLQVLREANSSQCVSCQSTNIIEITDSASTSRGKDYSPNVITLNNYKDHVGSVVTFEGLVQSVKESRRGSDFAVMFENKSWVKGFKLVFFQGAVRKVGGKPYINSLNRKTVRVRGLLIKHEKFGYEIIVSEKSMIMSTK